jgi:hypothetical protein
MKLATAAFVTASLTLAPLPSQAFFLNEETLNYKLHIVECLGLLFSDRHADECGGVVTAPFNASTLASPVSGGGGQPGAKPPKPDCDEEWEGSSLLEGLAIGERVRVAASSDCEEIPL